MGKYKLLIILMIATSNIACGVLYDFESRFTKLPDENTNEISVVNDPVSPPVVMPEDATIVFQSFRISTADSLGNLSIASGYTGSRIMYDSDYKLSTTLAYSFFDNINTLIFGSGFNVYGIRIQFRGINPSTIVDKSTGKMFCEILNPKNYFDLVLNAGDSFPLQTFKGIVAIDVNHKRDFEYKGLDINGKPTCVPNSQIFRVKLIP